MSDPQGMEQDLTGMLPNGSFTDDTDDPSTGEGGDAQTVDIEREGEPDPGPEIEEPGQG